MRVLCAGYASVNQRLVGEHLHQPFRRWLERQQVSEDAACCLVKKLCRGRGVGMIRKETFGDEIALRGTGLVSNILDLVDWIPVRAARIKRVQDDVSFGIVMLLQKLAYRVIDDDCLELFAARDLVYQLVHDLALAGAG